MQNKGRSFAAFDIDGTLVRGSIGVDFVNWLYERGEFPKDIKEIINQADDLHSTGQISYIERGKIILTHWAKGFSGMSVEKLRKLCDEHNKTYTNIFDGSIELVHTLKDHGFVIMSLTRPFEEIILSLDDMHNIGFDDVFGTRMEIRDGLYTGKLLNEMWDLPAKGLLLESAIAQKDLSPHGSFAFGDTVQDISMLEQAEHPVCLHPTEDLLAEANRRNWAHFISARDVLRWLPDHLSDS